MAYSVHPMGVAYSAYPDGWVWLILLIPMDGCGLFCSSRWVWLILFIRLGMRFILFTPMGVAYYAHSMGVGYGLLCSFDGCGLLCSFNGCGLLCSFDGRGGVAISMLIQWVLLAYSVYPMGVAYSARRFKIKKLSTSI